MCTFAIMKEIKLNKAEKKTLRQLSLGFDYEPDGLSHAAWLSALRSLKSQGLAYVAFIEGGDAEACEISDEGKALLERNPHLWNPIDWGMVGAIGTVLAVIVAVLALLVACGQLG